MGPGSSRRDLLRLMALGGAVELVSGAAGASTNAMSGKFTGKVVAITGATSGIGEAAARAFAREGAKVFFCGRRRHLGSAVEKSIREAGGDAKYIHADVRIESSVKAFVEKGVAHFGRLDIAFNNAGIGAPKAVSVGDLDDSSFDDVYKTNAKGIFYSIKHEVPYLEKSGGGVILNMASIAAHKPYAKMAAYSASKASVVSISKSAAAEYGYKNIRINSVSPGWVDTPARTRLFEVLGLDPKMTPTNVLRRLMTVDEVVNCVLFACAPDSVGLHAADIDLSFGELNG